MQCDDLNWNMLDNGYCGYKVVTKPQKFCRNEYNVSGLCNRASCPLANSQYATVREEKGLCYLYMKVPERSHFPAKMWEKVPLSKKTEKAVVQLSENLTHWGEFARQKCKARLIRIHEYLSRKRHVDKQAREPKILTKPRKTEQRERRREEKALVAAKLETSIEQELMRRLQKGYYGEVYSQKEKRRALADRHRQEEEVEDEQEVEYEYEMEEEEPYERQLVEDFEESDDEGEKDIEDL